ncbi:MAG: hypothetical protein LBR54_02410 [Oscillospiraceae bacterium]|jgi:hypothetical protein|nr:hypothetical protein [Oscillospiraceae bacterium]
MRVNGRRVFVVIIVTLLLIVSNTVYAIDLIIPGSNQVFIPQDKAALLPELSVVVPTTIDFVISPFANGDTGQITSETCQFYNESNVDVLITFMEMSFIIAEEAHVVPLISHADINSISTEKEIFMQLDFGREDIPPVILTDLARTVNPSVVLSAAGAEGSLLSLNLTGSVNSMPNPQWKDGDVKVKLSYHIEAIYVENEMNEVFPLYEGSETSYNESSEYFTGTPEPIEEPEPVEEPGPDSSGQSDSEANIPESIETPEPVETPEPIEELEPDLSVQADSEANIPEPIETSEPAKTSEPEEPPPTAEEVLKDIIVTEPVTKPNEEPVEPDGNTTGSQSPLL